ncbi:MAG: mobile mystery protein B [Proteobacteria bacterium]|nr:mobile mystery protein B [Pseudomonadota bacterium]
MIFDNPSGATPLDPDEAEGLLLPHITMRAELDRWEQENIAEAEARAFRRAHPDILTDGFAKRLFGLVWRWAGSYRKTGKNIGLPAWQIATELRTLYDDCAVWIEHDVYTADEIAVRFHHRLTAILPFANGNGRHARLMTDILLANLLKKPRFTWGSGNLVDAGDCRKQYINALRAADRYDYGPLLAFVRS